MRQTRESRGNETSGGDKMHSATLCRSSVSNLVDSALGGRRGGGEGGRRGTLYRDPRINMQAQETNKYSISVFISFPSIVLVDWKKVPQ
jgi:hypothetical protein